MFLEYAPNDEPLPMRFPKVDEEQLAHLITSHTIHARQKSVTNDFAISRIQKNIAVERTLIML